MPPFSWTRTRSKRWRRGITNLIEDQSLRADMISRGHARVQQFSWRAAAEHTLAVYREAAESH